MSLKRLVAVSGVLQEVGNYSFPAFQSSTFFKTRSPVASGPRCRFACGGELLRFPASPVNTFFQLRFAFQRPVRFRFPEAEVSFYARPPGPSTSFFTQLEAPFAFDPRCGFPQRAELNSRACDACQLVFSITLRFLAIPVRPAPVSRSGGELLRASVRSVNVFFQSSAAVTNLSHRLT